MWQGDRRGGARPRCRVGNLPTMGGEGSADCLTFGSLLFSDFADGGPMWTAQGHRESRTPVVFPTPFRHPPAVIVGISLMDLDHSTNNRTEILAERVTATAFDIVFRTWGDRRWRGYGRSGRRWGLWWTRMRGRWSKGLVKSGP